MKVLFSLIVIIFLTNCSKPRTVYICGDHECVNKAEARQYFEENLTLEIKVLDKRKNKKVDLVELNLKEITTGNKQISISTKEKTSKDLKILSKEDIVEIKKKIKNKRSVKKINKKQNDKQNNREIVKKKDIFNKKDSQKEKNLNIQNKKIKNSQKRGNNEIVNKKQKEIVDVCTILEKCSIDEISKYLIKEGKKKSFPDITLKQ